MDHIDVCLTTATAGSTCTTMRFETFFHSESLLCFRVDCRRVHVLFSLQNQEVQSVNQWHRPPECEAETRCTTGHRPTSRFTNRNRINHRSSPALSGSHALSHSSKKRGVTSTSDAPDSHRHDNAHFSPERPLKARTWLQFWALFQRFSVERHAIKILRKQFKYFFLLLLLLLLQCITIYIHHQ